MTDTLQPTVSTKPLQESVADLQSVNFCQGFKRFSLLGSIAAELFETNLRKLLKLEN